MLKMLEIITCFRSSIFVLGFLFFMQVVLLAMGNTNAALPTNRSNTNANSVELTAMEVPRQKQIV